MKKSAQKKSKNKALIRAVKHWSIPVLTALTVISITTFTVLQKYNPPQVTNMEATASAVILPAENISLPTPELRSGNSLESVLKNRRTRRDFLDSEIGIKQISQMLWAAQGVTVDWGGRTAPSAKSVYPLSIYLIASKVESLTPGEYQYIPGDRTPVHALKPIKSVELQKALYDAMNESSFKNAPAVLVITGNMGKMAEAYGNIPHDKEVYLEAGHAAQNLYLQAESLHLGTVVISTFNEAKVLDLVTIPVSETIIYLVPLGNPKI